MAANFSTKHQTSNRRSSFKARSGALFSFNPFLDVWKSNETPALAFNMLRPNEEVSMEVNEALL